MQNTTVYLAEASTFSDALVKFTNAFGTIAAFLAVLLIVFFAAGRASGRIVKPLTVVVFLGPALVLGYGTGWWAYLAGPVAGSVLAVGMARVLRGRGGGRSGVEAAQGTLGIRWRPGPSQRP